MIKNAMALSFDSFGVSKGPTPPKRVYALTPRRTVLAYKSKRNTSTHKCHVCDLRGEFAAVTIYVRANYALVPNWSLLHHVIHFHRAPSLLGPHNPECERPYRLVAIHSTSIKTFWLLRWRSVGPRC